MCACGSSTTNHEYSADIVSEVRDTQNIVNFKNPFTSFDRQLFDLRGNVSKVLVKKAICDSTWTSLENLIEDKFSFKVNGEVVFDSNSKRKLARNSKGQLTSKQTYIKDYDFYISEEFSYNQQGLLDTLVLNGLENAGVKTFKYDSNWDCISAISSTASEGSEYEEEFSYMIMERDDKGNWTKRRISSVLKCIDNGSEEKYYSIETRDITYY